MCRAWRIAAGTDVSSLCSQRSCFAWGENCPGGVGSDGFSAEVWCQFLSVAARGCLCVKNCQNKVCVLGVEGRKGTLLGKAGSLGAECHCIEVAPSGNFRSF